MNVAAVFAPKKAYEFLGCGTFTCVLEHQFAATTRTRLMMDMCKLHGILRFRRKYAIAANQFK